MRSRKARLLAPLTALLLFGTFAVGTVAAAGPKSATFDATFCTAEREVPDPEDPENNPPILVRFIDATITWSGYPVDGVSMGMGDGQGAGFGFIEPVDPLSRSGSITLSLGADEGSVIVGVDIRIKNKIWASEEIDRPAGGWADLDACA